MDNAWFKFESKIQSNSKVTVFTRNHKDDKDDAHDDETRNKAYRPNAHLSDILIQL